MKNPITFLIAFTVVWFTSGAVFSHFHKTEVKAAEEPFKVGDCIRWKEDDLERWETSKHYIEKILEFGNRKVRIATWFPSLPGYYEDKYSSVYIDQLKFYEKVSCPEKQLK